MLIRLVMEPMRQYMQAQLVMASDESELRESAKLAHVLSRGESGRGARRVRAAELACGTHDAVFFDQLQKNVQLPNAVVSTAPSPSVGR